MPLSLAQLRTPMTRAECLTSILGTLQTLGFAATSWQSGGVVRTMLTAVAQVWSDITNVVDSMSRATFNVDSTGDALTAFSLSHYDNTRAAALYTSGVATLTCSAAAGPYVIAVGQLQASDTVNGYTYRNTTGGVLAAGGTLSLTWQAEVAGAARNIAINTLTNLNTALAGVTVNNPDPGTGAWITSYGTDAETDATLRTRNTSRWSTLSYASPGDAYVQFALAADADVQKVLVNDANPGGPGTVYIYLARANVTATSGAPTEDVETVQAYVNLKRPCTSAVTCFPAPEQDQDFIATVYITAAYNTIATQNAVVAARDAYLATLPIGGTVLPPGAVGYMIHSELTATITAVDGVVAVVWNDPTANEVIGASSLMTVGGGSVFTYQSV